MTLSCSFQTCYKSESNNHSNMTQASQQVTFYPGHCFSSTRSDLGNHSATIKCTSKPKPSRIRSKNSKVTFLEKTCVRMSFESRLCMQIEKLALCGRHRQALDLFEVLERQGGFQLSRSTCDALVSACIGLRSTRWVERVFDYMRSHGSELDQYMCNRVLLMYVKCGMASEARKWFDEMPWRDFATWDIVIGVLLDVGDYKGAYDLFLVMWEEFSDCDPRTVSRMIRTSASLESISMGRQFHGCAVKMGLVDNVFISCALIDMYSKCGSIEDAQHVFDEMPEKTTVGWNTIIAGYALHGYTEEALKMCYEMHESSVGMDQFTLSLIVRICVRLASVDIAKQVHAALFRHGFGSDLVANTALVDLYSKWGKIEDARNVFDLMPRKNILSWNALIGGYGIHGKGVEAIKMFKEMLAERIRPNHVTFLAVLSACRFSGLSESGWEIFQSMTRDHKIEPRAMHYACMVELLGRGGLLDEALSLIRAAPFEPNANTWAALLTASRVHGNLELGKIASEKLYGMEPEKLSNYIVLLNIYNSSGRRKEAAAVVQTLKQKNLNMFSASSWIEISGQQHVFYSGDKSHLQATEIFHKVDELTLEISKHGYVYERKYLLPDVDDWERHNLRYHSEKMAIAFGLISTPNSKPLRIVQSHRICGDCHNAIKLIASITGRDIVVRDASRFHHFRDGRCSCGDYW